MSEDQTTGKVSPSSTNPLSQEGNLFRSLADLSIIDFFHLPSPHVTPQHMLELKNWIEAHQEDFDGVVITHGTDTMSESARYIAEHAELGSKVVVLTGAMQPAVMAHSDAGFNLGAAISALNLLKPGVYISMSGRIFPAHTVRKDRARGIFEG